MPGKIRLVFDAAARSGGSSLNDMLLPGPDMLKSLTGVLHKFRKREIRFGGDIQEMFYRVLIRDEDTAAQRFLWREGESHREPDVYEIKARIFGSTSSPCSAQYVKNRHALEFADEFPQAAKAITDRHYVDEYFDSVHTDDQAVTRMSEVSELHRRGGFLIRNWTCNSQAVLNHIPENLRAQKKEQHSNGDHTERVLGVHWNAELDSFTFKLHFSRVPDGVLNGSKCPTKTEVLKLLMSLFDPLGFLANYTVAGKILVQDVWRNGFGWDDELSGLTLQKWKQWIGDLPLVKKLKIPRCYNTNMKKCSRIELHMFCDASEKAFAAVGYLKCTNPDGVQIFFIKSRVSPLRPMSIPRLELQAAVLGCRLAETIIESHEIDITNTYFWTDSRTVLCWIRSDARKFKQFVAFRVGEILESTNATAGNGSLRNKIQQTMPPGIWNPPN